MLVQSADPSKKFYYPWIRTRFRSCETGTPEVRASVGPLLLRQVPDPNGIPACRRFRFAINELMREYEELGV